MRTVSTSLQTFGLLVACLLTVLLSAGCTSTPKFAEIPGVTTNPTTAAATAPGAPGAPAAPVSAHPSTGGFDQLGIGDTLSITLSDIPYVMPPTEERIKDDGTITLTQNQTFKAAGKTRGELEREIRERYVPKFFKTMTVSVRHQKDTQFFFVGGEVKTPGRQVFISRMTVTKAIQSAGDFTDYANKRKVVLTRGNGTVEYVNCVKAIEDPSLDPEIYPGDKIHVKRKIF